jgi:subtilase family serine protease
MQQGHDQGAQAPRGTSRGVRAKRRQRILRRLTILATAVAVMGVALTSLLGGAAQATSTSKLHLVPGFLPGLRNATLLHLASPSMKMEIGVGIARPDTTGELALYKEMYDPSSPQFHHFLTVSQFNTRFGVKASTSSAVRSFLTGGGLSIDTSSTDGDYFTATGTVAQLDSLLKLKIGQYSIKGTKFYANSAAPSVPVSLPIDAITGLDTIHKMNLADLKGRTLAGAKASAQADVAAGRRVLARQAAQTHRAAITSGASKASGLAGTSQTGDEQVYTPQDLWGIYDDPGAATLTDSTGTSTASTVAASPFALGQGQTIGIFGEGETSSVTAQLRLFESTEGLPKVPVRTVETEGAPDSDYGDNTGAVEWYLDSQSSTGMAPDVKQLDYFFSKTLYDPDIAKSFDFWANDANGPTEMNASFGECEEDPTNAVTGPLSQLPYGTELGDELEAVAEPMLRQATMEGRTLFSSAGDTGSGCPEVVLPVVGAANGLANQPVPIVSYPCASDYDVCVGGTVLSSPGKTYPSSAQRSAETSWTNGGGGTSYFIPAQSFQSGITNIDRDCVATPDGTTVYTTNAPLCRGVPDVSDLSGNSAGDAYFIYIDGAASSEGGTSLSSPLMMGQWSRIQSAAPAAQQKTGGLGYADPIIYAQAASADKCTTAPCGGMYGNEFNDITASEDAGDLTGVATGSPVVSTGIGTGNGEFNDTPGWDYASGWGSLQVGNFMQAVDGSTNATDAYTGAEQNAAPVCIASMTSPTGNATDPVEVSLGNVAGEDLTGATLSASATAVTATLTVPDLSAGPTPYGSATDFTVAWLYNGKVYEATAAQSASGTFTYSDSATKPTATGTDNTTTGVITITVPVADVGSPPVGAVLAYPQAFDALDAAALALTIDSADNLRAYSVDDGQLDSIGVGVVVGGVLGSSCTNTLPTTNLTTAGTGTGVSSTTSPTSTKPTTPTTTTTTTKSGTTVACETTSKLPVTHITKKSLTRTKISLLGYAAAHCPDKITKVGVAVAKTVIKTVKVRRATRTVKVKKLECEFLTSKHKFTKAGSCAPRDYFTAKGLSHWTFSLKLKFGKGTYRIWEHATDNKKYTTKNTAGKFVFFRVS